MLAHRLNVGTRLHEEVVLVPTGGTHNLMVLASIMFAKSGVEGHRMVVLLDSDAAGITAQKGLKEKLFRDGSGVLMVGDVIGVPGGILEDLLPRADYASAVGSALGRTVDLDAGELAAPTNVAALQKHWQRKGWGKFGMEEKIRTVLWLIDKWNASPAQIPEETRQRASALFDAINRHFVN